MPDPQPSDPEFRTVFIRAGVIKCDRIEAGSIPDPDGALAAMTDQLIADLRAANNTAPEDDMTRPLSGLVSGKIQAGSVRDARITTLDVDVLDLFARAMLAQTERRMALLNEFDTRHPVLHGLRWWPVLGMVYQLAWRRYVLSREPQIGHGEPRK